MSMQTPPAPERKKFGRGTKIALGVSGGFLALCCGGGLVNAVTGGSKNAIPDLPSAEPTTAVAAAVPETPSPTDSPSPTEASPSPQPPPAPIVFRVTGYGTADVTYVKDAKLDQAQENGVALPWRKQVPDDGAVLGYNLIAQRQSGDGGSITCTISRGSDVLVTNTSSGPYSVVTCSTQ